MAKIPFNIKYRPQIEAGEYKVEARDGRPVRIICWDRKESDSPVYSIVALLPETEGGESVMVFLENGNAISGHETRADLFVVTPEEEPTEFEKRLVKFYNDRNGLPHDKDGVYSRHDLDELLHNTAAELLAIARKELEPEVLERLEEAYKNQDDVVYENGKRDGKAEAMKDLPRWRKCADADILDSYTVKHWIVRFDNDVITESAIIHLGHYIGFADLEKLPGFKED